MATAIESRRSARVVPRCEPVCTEFPDDVVQKGVELHVLVARNARVRCLPAGVRIDEAIDDTFAEHVGVVESIEGNAERGRGAACLLPRLVSSTAARCVHIAGRRNETHPHPNDVLPTVGEDGRRDRRVDAARHGDNYSHFSLCARGPTPAHPCLRGLYRSALVAATVRSMRRSEATDR